MASRAILAGIKTAAVINVGTATIGALIGAGGFGQPILTGIRRDDVSTILFEGAIPAARARTGRPGGFRPGRAIARSSRTLALIASPSPEFASTAIAGVTIAGRRRPTVLYEPFLGRANGSTGRFPPTRRWPSTRARRACPACRGARGRRPRSRMTLARAAPSHPTVRYCTAKYRRGSSHSPAEGKTRHCGQPTEMSERILV